MHPQSSKSGVRAYGKCFKVATPTFAAQALVMLMGWLLSWPQSPSWRADGFSDLSQAGNLPVKLPDCHPAPADQAWDPA